MPARGAAPCAQTTMASRSVNACRNVDLQMRLQPPLLAWYRALDAVLPGRVHSLPTAWPMLIAMTLPRSTLFEMVGVNGVAHPDPAERTQSIGASLTKRDARSGRRERRCLAFSDRPIATGADNHTATIGVSSPLG